MGARPSFLFICWLTLAAALCSFAQEEELRGTNEGKESPRILLVIDTSGSMVADGKLTDAIDWAMTNIVEVPYDDMEVGVITFNFIVNRHLHSTEDGGEELWFRLPAGAAYEGITELLESLSSGGNTRPDPALAQAFRSGAQSVIFITDGDFDPDQSPERVIAEAQKWAEENDRQLPMFTTIGVHPDPEDQERLRQLANAAGGDLWVREPDPVSDPEEIPDDPFDDIDLPY